MEPGIYSLKKEFAPMLGIPNNQIDRRKEELYEWLKNFFVFEILDGVPIRIHIKETIGEQVVNELCLYENEKMG